MSVGRFPGFALSCFICLICFARAEEPFFKKNDVIALVGGEDMVAASEYGYLELLLTRALPDLHLKFRCLAWEGDTVFEQRRDLNYPTLEQQLDQIGATVVIAQFGQMESLRNRGLGKAELRAGEYFDWGDLSPKVTAAYDTFIKNSEAEAAEFVTVYEKLIGRLGENGKRRVIVVTPHSPEPSRPLDASTPTKWETVLGQYVRAISELAERRSLRIVDLFGETHVNLRDGVHLLKQGQAFSAVQTLFQLSRGAPDSGFPVMENETLLRSICAKNRLWFNYYRPQNWAFLAGDRTNQPSSRDHLDPTKRWFPAELDQFLPLIEAKDREIWELAAELAKDANK